jgi:hypothetical protein
MLSPAWGGDPAGFARGAGRRVPPRDGKKRLARLPPPKPPPYKKTGDVVVDVNVTELQAKLQKKQEQDGSSQSSAPPKK